MSNYRKKRNSKGFQRRPAGGDTMITNGVNQTTTDSVDRIVQGVILKKFGQSEKPDADIAIQGITKKTAPDRVTSSANDPGDEEPDEDDEEGGDEGTSEEAYTITESVLRNIVEQQVAPLQEKIKTIQAESESKVAAVKAEADVEKEKLKSRLQQVKAVNDLLTKNGVSPQLLNTATAQNPSNNNSGNTSAPNQVYIAQHSGNYNPADMLKEMERIYESATKIQVVTDYGIMTQSSDNELLELYAGSKESRRACRQGLELYAKKCGLLNGLKGSAVTQAGTTTGDITPFLLKTLSTFMRTTMVGKHNWQQFITSTISQGRNRGESVEVPRYNFLSTSRNPVDYEIGRDDDLTTSKQPISVGSELVTLSLYALGKAGLAGNLNAPVSIAKFFEATTIQDLTGILQKILYESYLQFQTAAISTEFAKSTVRYFNKAGTGVTNSASLVAGDGGQLTADFLEYMGAVMSSSVPAYANGKYVLQCGPFELLQLSRSLKEQKMSMTKASIEELSLVLHPNTPSGEVMPVSGYVGDLGQFMIFETGTVYDMPTNRITPDPTIAASAREIHDAYAFGADTVGHAQAMPFTLIYDSNTNFSLRNTVAWASIEKYQAIDVDPSLSPATQTVKQQQRVYKLACSRTPI